MYWIQRGARFWGSSGIHPAPPTPPEVHLSLWLRFQGEVVDPALFMSAVKQTEGGSRNAGAVCCFGFEGPEEVVVVVVGGLFLEPPHHNRTTNPDPQDGHGQDGREGQKQQQRGRRRKAASQGWRDDARGGRRGDIQTPPPPPSGAGFALRLPPPSIRRF